MTAEKQEARTDLMARRDLTAIRDDIHRLISDWEQRYGMEVSEVRLSRSSRYPGYPLAIDQSEPLLRTKLDQVRIIVASEIR